MKTDPWHVNVFLEIKGEIILKAASSWYTSFFSGIMKFTVLALLSYHKTLPQKQKWTKDNRFIFLSQGHLFNQQQTNKFKPGTSTLNVTPVKTIIFEIAAFDLCSLRHTTLFFM